MYEESKLKEAKYFHSKMVSKIDNHDHFHYNLSAFLSATRSVLLYAFEETKGKSDSQQWYEKHMTSSKVLAFFRNKRNISVHTQPVQANQHTAIQMILPISSFYRIKISDQTGRLVDKYSSEPPPAPKIPHKVTHRFFFSDWPGTEDVLQLCDLYLNELQYVVENGQNNGFLTK